MKITVKDDGLAPSVDSTHPEAFTQSVQPLSEGEVDLGSRVVQSIRISTSAGNAQVPVPDDFGTGEIVIGLKFRADTDYPYADERAREDIERVRQMREQAGQTSPATEEQDTLSRQSHIEKMTDEQKQFAQVAADNPHLNAEAVANLVRGSSSEDVVQTGEVVENV